MDALAVAAYSRADRVVENLSPGYGTVVHGLGNFERRLEARAGLVFLALLHERCHVYRGWGLGRLLWRLLSAGDSAERQ